MAVPRSQSAPHISSLQYTKITPVATSTAENSERHLRPLLPRHRSAVAISGAHLQPWVKSRGAERDDPFSLSGFFPASFTALESATTAQEWDWLRASEDGLAGDSEDDDDAVYRSGLVSPISESDDEWSIPTPCSPDVEDVLAGAAIKREDRLGILALSDTLFMPPRGDELYVEDRLLSPYTQAGDPLEADAVYDTLRALRTAHSLPHGSAVKDESAATRGLFSPQNETEDKLQVEMEGWGALVSWGVSKVVDYLSPV